jgi:glutamine synthetase
MSSALVLQFGETGPPGLLGNWLAERDIAMAVHHADEPGEAPDPREHAFVACLGARWNPTDDEPAVLRARTTVERALEADVPVLGLCFGGQLLAHALGGDIAQLPDPALGWVTIESDEPQAVPAGPWLAWHWYGFTTPPGAHEIARSTAGPQAFRHGRHLGVQFHPESTVEIVSVWARSETEKVRAAGLGESIDRVEVGRAHARRAAADAYRLFDHFWAQARSSNGRSNMAHPEVHTLADVHALADDARITTIRVMYPDLHGGARAKDVPLREFERVTRQGLCFCSSVMATDLRHTPVLGAEEGYPDMHAVPDLDTLVALPWEPGVAACLADLHPVPDGPAIADPRGAVRRATAGLAELGFTAQIGPELEFFLLEPDETKPGGVRRRVDRLSMVYTAGPQVDPGGFVRRLTEQLAEMGLGAYAANHEYMNSQYEINLHHGEAVDAADRAFRLKSAVKDVAAINGLIATFMGKPFNDQGGSGTHLHVSLNRDGANAFDAPAQPNGVSEDARFFLGGVMAHASALMAFLNPTINAYRRLVPDSLAPTHANWGWDNRSAFVRVPPERGAATRLELRVGDGAANPYLAIAVVLQAGLHGLRDRIEPPAPVAGDAYRAEGAGDPLPQSLEAALDALEADDVLIGAVGPEIVTPFMAMKRFEIERHRAHVSDWELEEYLHHL